jgi:hypothetical protein
VRECLEPRCRRRGFTSFSVTLEYFLPYGTITDVTLTERLAVRTFNFLRTVKKRDLLVAPPHEDRNLAVKAPLPRQADVIPLTFVCQSDDIIFYLMLHGLYLY